MCQGHLLSNSVVRNHHSHLSNKGVEALRGLGMHQSGRLKGQLLQAPYSRAGTGDMGPQEEGQSSLAPYCTHGPRGHLSGLGGWGTEGPCPPH